MAESAIKAEVFASVRKKKDAPASTPKPRTALFQEGENDVNIPTLAAASESVIHDKTAKKISDINAQLNEPSEHDITIKGNSSIIIHCLGESCDASKSPIQFGSLPNFVGHHSKKDENIIFTKMMKPVEIIPKPRTALLQGGEDDEPITPHIISTPNSCVISSKTDNSYLNCPVLQFGAIHFDLEHSGNRAKFASSGLSSNIIFNGAVLLKNEEKKIPRSWRD